MNCFKVYDLTVFSEINLPSAFPVDDHVLSDSEPVVIKYSDLKEEYLESMQAKKISCDNGFATYRITEQIWLVNIYRIGMFRISSGKLIEYMKTVDVDASELEQWLLNYCISIIMIQRGRIVLHGSGLLYNGSMILISGESGSGKSTLADALLAEGMGFAADDSVCVRTYCESASSEIKVQGIGAYPIRRLCDDLLTDEEKKCMIYQPDGDKKKYAYNMRHLWPEGYSELKYLFIIQPDNSKEVSVSKVEGMDKLKAIIQCLYKRGSYVETGLSAQLMTELVKIANMLQIYYIHRPMGKITVKQQRNMIYRIINS